MALRPVSFGGHCDVGSKRNRGGQAVFLIEAVEKLRVIL